MEKTVLGEMALNGVRMLLKAFWKRGVNGLQMVCGSAFQNHLENGLEMVCAPGGGGPRFENALEMVCELCPA